MALASRRRFFSSRLQALFHPIRLVTPRDSEWKCGDKVCLICFQIISRPGAYLYSAAIDDNSDFMIAGFVGFRRLVA